jgi:hypothetical protein
MSGSMSMFGVTTISVVVSIIDSWHVLELLGMPRAGACLAEIVLAMMLLR